MIEKDTKYQPDSRVQPGDELVYTFGNGTESAMTVADPAYDEKDRVVIVEECDHMLGNRRAAAPAVRRYTRTSKKLRSRIVRRAA